MIDFTAKISFSSVWENLIDFAKKPRLNPLPESFLVAPEKVFPYLLGIDFLLMIPTMLLISLTGVEGDQHETANLLDDPLQLALFAVIVAPILEELIFRFPIGEWWKKADFFGLSFDNTPTVQWCQQNFKRIFWSFTLGFAAIHFSNFTSSVPFYFAPILVLPQLILGIVLGYIRLGWGTRYSILFHAIHNGIPVLLLLFGGGPPSN